MTVVTKEQIIELLNGVHEHTFAKDVFVPVFKKMGLLGVKFTGGPDEMGIDIEYYELTKPENHRSYVGVQFKKGDLLYSSGGAKNSVKEVKNQAEEAFEKEIHDIDSHATVFISRFIVATTGDINEKARTYIGRARQKGLDRRIDYWTGDRLAEYIQSNWMMEFTQYFSSSIPSTTDKPSEEDSQPIVDAEYIVSEYPDLVHDAKRVMRTIGGTEKDIVMTIASFSVDSSWIGRGDLLLELECKESFISEELSHLASLDYVDFRDNELALSGNAQVLRKLFTTIDKEIIEAGDEALDIKEIFREVLRG